MAKVFKHDCKFCDTETTHDVNLLQTKLNVKCMKCGTLDSVPIEPEHRGNRFLNLYTRS